MPIFVRFNSYIEFLIQILQIVRNMQNSAETHDNLCTELGWPVLSQALVTSLLRKLTFSQESRCRVTSNR